MNKASTMDYPVKAKMVKYAGNSSGHPDSLSQFPSVNINEPQNTRILAAFNYNQTIASDREGALRDLMDRYDYRVVVGFRVENKTDRPLTDPVVHVKGGAVEMPFLEILPKSSAMFVTRKHGLTTTGSYGTVSWKVSTDSGLPRRVVVMWSAPFNHDFFDNYLAVGISDKATDAPDYDWFDTMYGTTKEPKAATNYRDRIVFNRRNFSKLVEKVRFSEGGISVEGTMGTHHKTQIIVTIQEEEREMQELPRPPSAAIRGVRSRRRGHDQSVV